MSSLQALLHSWWTQATHALCKMQPCLESLAGKIREGKVQTLRKELPLHQQFESACEHQAP